MQEIWVWILGLEDTLRSKCNPLQYSCLGNPMDQRSLLCYSPRGAKSQIRLSTHISPKFCLWHRRAATLKNDFLHKCKCLLQKDLCFQSFSSVYSFPKIISLRSYAKRAYWHNLLLYVYAYFSICTIIFLLSYTHLALYNQILGLVSFSPICA